MLIRLRCLCNRGLIIDKNTFEEGPSLERGHVLWRVMNKIVMVLGKSQNPMNGTWYVQKMRSQ